MATHGHDQLPDASRRAVAGRENGNLLPFSSNGDAPPALLSTPIEGVGEGVQVKEKEAAVVVVELVVFIAAVAATAVVVLVVFVIVVAFVVVVIVAVVAAIVNVFIVCCCRGGIVVFVVVVSCYENVDVVSWI